MPLFAPNQVLGAADLNRIGAAQEFIHQRNLRLNAAVAMHSGGGIQTVWLAHYYRYIVFKVWLDPNTNNNIVYYLQAENVHNQMVSLHQIEGNPAHPNFRLGWHTGVIDMHPEPPVSGWEFPWWRGVKYYWFASFNNQPPGTNGSLRNFGLHESDHASGIIPAPSSNGPIFTPTTVGNGTLLSSTMNGISYNTQYLLQQGGHYVQNGCVVYKDAMRIWGAFTSEGVKTMYWRVHQHAHRYVYVRARIHVGSGVDPNINNQGDQMIRFNVYIRYTARSQANGSTYSPDEGYAQLFDLTFDVKTDPSIGDDSWPRPSYDATDPNNDYTDTIVGQFRDFHIWRDISQYYIPLGSAYTIEVGQMIKFGDWGAGEYIRTLFVGESSTYGIPEG